MVLEVTAFLEVTAYSLEIVEGKDRRKMAAFLKQMECGPASWVDSKCKAFASTHSKASALQMSYGMASCRPMVELHVDGGGMLMTP
jgi:hypothetical protein